MPKTQENIVDVLLAQHEQIKKLFTQVESAQGATKKQLFEELVGVLAVHETVEESMVHPLAESKLHDGGTVVPPRLEEEQDAKRALAKLYDLGVDNPRFDGELVVLRNAVLAHARAEERLEFAPLRDVVDPDQLAQLKSAMRVIATLAPTRPHPEVPPQAAANLLLGPPLAVFDRVRDALREATKARL